MTMAPLKRFVQLSRPITYGIVQAGPEIPDGVPYIRPIDMTEHDGIRSIPSLPRTSHDIALQYRRSKVEAGDIVISIGPSYGKTMIVPLSLAGANLTQGTARVAPAAGCDVRYLRWCLRSNVATAHWDAAVGGATFRALNLAPLAETPIAVRSLVEQRHVADFLDRETARSDALIAAKCRMIELLEERMTVLAESAVLTALDERNLVPLKYLVRESDERLGPRDDLPLMSVSIHLGVVPRAEASDRESRADDFSNYKVCHAGDIVINRMRAFQGGVGVAPCAGIVSPDYTVLRVGSRLQARFLHYVMRSPWFVGEMTRRLRGIGSFDQAQVRTPRVNFADLGEISLPIISLTEQSHLTAQFDIAHSESTRLRDLLLTQIDLVTEHRQALITAAVTGELSSPWVAA